MSSRKAKAGVVRPALRSAVAPPGGARPGAFAWLCIVAAAALALRIGLYIGFSGYLYPGDHDDFVRWGLQCVERGVLTLYTEPPARRPQIVWFAEQRAWVVGERAFDRVCNYPPLSAYLLAISGAVYNATWTPWSADDIARRNIRGELPAGFGRTPPVNTIQSQVLFTFWSTLADYVLAAGCAAIAARVLSRTAAIWTFAIVLFAPPFWWDSIVWAQTDTLVLAPGVWMLHFLMQRRFLAAGVMWGVAFGLKTQAILFIPIWGYALVRELLAVWMARPAAAPRGTPAALARAAAGPVLGGAAAVVVLFLIALPFTLSSGAAWFQRSYFENLFETYAELTTLKAFNVWYLVLLTTDVLDAGAIFLGLALRTWGTLLLVLSLAGAFCWTLRRFRDDASGLVVWSGLSLLLIVMLPTKVHERYMIMSLPFIGLSMLLSWRPAPGLVLLTVAMMGQLSWPFWMPLTPRGKWPELEADLRARHAAYMRSAPQEIRSQAPPVEWFVGEQRREYETRLSRTSDAEWAMTLSSLFGAAACAGALASLRCGGEGIANSRERVARGGIEVRTPTAREGPRT